MLFLTPTEINSLTGKKRRPSQLKALRFMGIEHRIRPDGALIVSRTHVEKLLDGNPGNATIKRRVEPDWKAIDA